MITLHQIQALTPQEQEEFKKWINEQNRKVKGRKPLEMIEIKEQDERIKNGMRNVPDELPGKMPRTQAGVLRRDDARLY